MVFDRPITIYTANSRKATVLQAAPMTFSALFERLKLSQEISYTGEAYKALSKAKQDELKDVGAYIAGTLKDGRRRSGCVVSRCAAVLDADSIPPGGTDDFVRRVDSMRVCYCIHSTAKHTPATPRLRVVIPFSSDISADEYAPLVRLLCYRIQPSMEYFDPSCDQAGRIMYWPTHCMDVAPVFFSSEQRGLLDARATLNQQFTNWRDTTSWPMFSKETDPATLAAKATKQQDPLTKTGTVGAFCRVYDVPAAMAKFLPGVYEETATEGRYTFTGGSTTGGAILYEGGKFLYSHHATDPVGGRLVNSFDLVRLHLFGDMDDGEDVKEGTRGNRLPSFSAMCEFAVKDPLIKCELDRERREDAAAAFQPITQTAETDVENIQWRLELTRNSKSGVIEFTSKNVLCILENDPLLKGRMTYDSFSERAFGQAPLPWGNHWNETGNFEWTDSDDVGLAVYLEALTGHRSVKAVRELLLDHLTRHTRNPVQDYLKSLEWDGVPRLGTLFIDYLGAEDSPYTRAVTRKSFVAAVARVMRPGIKYDTMTILSGPQGIGKSTVIFIMGGHWFTDSIQTFKGKEPLEALHGKWLVEIAELQAFQKAEIEQIKRFLTAQEDYFRVAFGHRAASFPRRCVFFGTTNAKNFLRDMTGGRRFWPVYCGIQKHTKNVWDELPQERDQLWAEAYFRWQFAEPLTLPRELHETAAEVQEAARETDPREGIIRNFLDKPIPDDWTTWGTIRRRVFLHDEEGNINTDNMKLVQRNRVCVAEIWCELLGLEKAAMSNGRSREINSILESTPGWERIKNPAAFPPYGNQRGFQRIISGENGAIQ